MTSMGQDMAIRGRLVVEYMKEQLEGEGTRGKAARVQQRHLNIQHRQSVHRLIRQSAVQMITVNNCGQTAGSCVQSTCV